MELILGSKFNTTEPEADRLNALYEIWTLLLGDPKETEYVFIESR
jgi:hypothetical protein